MRIRLSRALGRILVVAAVCIAGAAVLPASPASAARRTFHTIFFTKEEMFIECLLNGGTFYTSGSLYGCHMADGGEAWCNNGNCYWLPADLKTAELRDILASVDVSAIDEVDPYPGDVVNNHQQVLALRPSATLTVEQLWAVAGGDPPVDTVRIVKALSTDLTAADLDTLASGKSVKDATVVGAVKPDAKLSLSSAAAQMAVTAQRVFAIRGETDVDGKSLPVLTILVAG